MQYLVPAIRVKNAKNKGQCKMAYSNNIEYGYLRYLYHIL